MSDVDFGGMLKGEQKMSETEITIWDLGGNYVCDNCGSDKNRLTFNTGVDGDWRARIEGGCYGGYQIGPASPLYEGTFFRALKLYVLWSDTKFHELVNLIVTEEVITEETLAMSMFLDKIARDSAKGES